MKKTTGQKTVRRLQLQRETLRTLTPEDLEQVAGGGQMTTGIDTCHNSCDLKQSRMCNV